LPIDRAGRQRSAWRQSADADRHWLHWDAEGDRRLAELTADDWNRLVAARDGWAELVSIERFVWIYYRLGAAQRLHCPLDAQAR